MIDPTPQQRADLLVRRLENFIRDGKSAHGMSFKTWQGMARSELTNAFADLERRRVRGEQDVTVKRIILVSVSTVVTIGFWGAVVVIDRRFGGLAAMICTGAGALLAAVAAELSFRHFATRYRTIAREKSLERVEDYDKQLRKLETDLWLKLKKAKEQEEAEED